MGARRGGDGRKKRYRWEQEEVKMRARRGRDGRKKKQRKE